MNRFFLLGTLATVVFIASTSHHMFALEDIPSEVDFNQVIANNKVVVDFYADWCGPCQRMKSTLEQVEKDNSDIVFVKVNIDSLKSLAQKYGVRSIPTIIFFNDGEVAGRMVGTKTKPEVIEKINKIFA